MTDTPQTDDEGIPEPSHSDFFHGDVAGGIEKMRRRLLDLTKRNRLLNYKYSKKGALRVVDELPDQLFEQLLDGKELFFKPVPRPQALRGQQASRIDPLTITSGSTAAVLAKLQALRAEFSRPPAAELPESLPGQQPSAPQHAESLGIRTSFDLPEAHAGGDEEPHARHVDRAIQTLQYPEDLESILRTLASAARLTIEETGTNMLYLAFGFLDWYARGDSEQVATAPLLLLPVSLRRADADSKTRAYRYAVQYSGEDVLANISLQELLKQDYAMELPDFDEEDAPEAYFAKLQPILAAQPQWKLRRHITLTLLSFGKLLMYRDLDPKNWPRDKGPAKHPRVREFFEGRQNNAIDFASEYELDDPPPSIRVPQLVDEADSSQHSALVDAVSGKNLVIAGPPGTGKSQTITNLIAAAMADGKRVLFVSEKLAALEVVRHRLERLGLGIFCLELHSHKSKKRALLDDIELRLKQQQTFADPASLQAKLIALEETKRHLSEYAQLINQPFGAQHQKLFDVIWAAARAKAGLGSAIPILEKERLRNAGSVTLDVVDSMIRVIDQYSEHFDAASAGTTLANHPWYGIRNGALTFRDERRVFDSLRSVDDALISLGSAIHVTNDLIAEGTQWIAKSIDALNTAIRVIGPLDVPKPVMRELLPRLDQTGAFRRIAEFIEWLESWRQLNEQMEAAYGKLPLYNAETIRAIKSQLDIVADTAPAIPRVADIRGVATLTAAAALSVKDACVVVDELQPLVGPGITASDQCSPAIDVLLETLAACPVTHLHLRHEALTTTNAVDVLRKAAAEAAAVRERIEKLSRHLDLALAPKGAELRKHIVAIKNSRWWSAIRSDYRQARRVHRAIIRSGSSSNAQMQSDFVALLQLENARSACEQNASYRAVAGPHFEGIESPFEELGKVAEWRVEFRRRFLPLGKQGEVVAETLWAAPTELVSVFATVEKSSRSRKSRHEGAIEQLRQARMAVGSVELQDSSWLALVPKLGSISSHLTEAFSYVGGVQLPATVQIAARSSLETALLERKELQERVEGAVEAAQLLGSDFGGIATSLPTLLATVLYWRSVSQADLPRSVRNWLLQQNADERLDRLRHHLGAAATLRDGVLERWKVFTELAHLLPSEWHRDKAAIEAHEIDSLLQRSRRALENEHTLSTWLEYLHAADELKQRELDYLVVLAEQERLPSSQLKQAFAFVQANSLVEEVFVAHPQLARFNGLSHEKVRKQFVELDKECIKLYRRRAAAIIGQRRVPSGVGYGPASAFTELSLIGREIAKQKRHIPLRQLMRRAGNALQALKPCFMMGPLSVAQYLHPGAIAFDLLIVDEASQLRPQDALGAIARVEQVVIVGDQMQLPPTSFFDRLGDDEEEEEESEGSAIEDSESILDVATSLYRPGRMLRWHYRSRHGSLIAFSNKEFYKNDLVVFPSPVPKSPTLGVKFVHVPDGVFDHRRNTVEAQRIVASALRHMEQRTSETLGIVAMNAPQRELLEELLEKQLKQHPGAEKFVSESEKGLEPVFVKNLENVQGDERDVIYISATYGRNASGHFFQRFGPILSHTGHRRLNVLFTRARKRVVLFSSMRAEDIKLTPGSSKGLTALKGYLSYAETGVLESAKFTGREPGSDFELEVADALSARGLEVVAQVGVAGYFLDLAVKHPDKRDAFILGIECDGASYHSSLSARDRDRLRQAVLESLGWTIHRVWSTDWLKQRERETERILARIEQLRSQPSDLSHDEDWVEESGAAIHTGSLSDDESWVDEVASQPLSEKQVREQLQTLRDAIAVADASITAEDSLLRPEMVELLIRTKPRTREDWQRSVPFEMRIATNGDHVSRYLARLLEVSSRLLR